MNSTTSRLNAYGAKLATLLGTASLLTMASAVVFKNAAYAGEAMTAQAGPEEVPENVLITGSLIRGTAAVGVPVTNLSPMDFATTGSLTTADLFKTFPQANVIPGPVGTQSGANIERAIKVNIRQLDTGSSIRSLLMVDGVRFPPQGNGLCELDPSIVPAISQDHIDVLVDGASATYGSDAIGGVVNIILRRNFDGAMTQLRYTTREGGGARYQASQLWGRTWDGGQITLSYEWYDESPVMGKAHSMFGTDSSPFGLDNETSIGSTNPGIINFGTLSTNNGGLSERLGTRCGYEPATGLASQTSQCYSIPHGSAGGPAFNPALHGGVGALTSSDITPFNFASIQNDSNFAGPLVASSGTRNEFNPYKRAWYDAAGQRNGGAVTFDQRLTKDINAFGAAFYSDRRAEYLNPSTLGPVANDAMVGIAIPTWNPYYPTNVPGGPGGTSCAGLTNTFCSAGTSRGLQINYDIGFEYPRLTTAYEVSAHYQIGLNIALPAGWEAQTFFAQTYDSSSSLVQNGVVVKNAVSAALGWTIQPIALSTTPNIPTWTKPANVPYLNVFCDASQFQCNSQDTLDYMAGFRQLRERFIIDEKVFKMDGPLFDLPGGTVKAAIGASLISNHFDYFQLDNTGGPTMDLSPSTSNAKRNIWAVFTQVNIPIFSDMNALPLLRRFELEGSWRHDQYSDVGGTSNPKIAFNWSPIDDLTFKGAWGTSFRAPFFGELSPLTNFASGGFNVGSTFGTSTTQIGANNCNTAGGPTAGSNAGKIQAAAKSFNSAYFAAFGTAPAGFSGLSGSNLGCVVNFNLAGSAGSGATYVGGGTLIQPLAQDFGTATNGSLVNPGGLTVNSDAADAAGLRSALNALGHSGYNGLVPEKTTNWGIGFDYAPTNFLKGLDIQVTYYMTRFSDLLANFSRTTSVGYNDPGIPFAFPTPTDVACPDVTITASPTNPINGHTSGSVVVPAALVPYECQTWIDMENSLLFNPRNGVNPQARTLIYWINDGGTFNKGWRKLDGIDWNWSYDWDMGNLGAFNIGQVGTFYLHDIALNALGSGPGQQWKTAPDLYHSTICAGNNTGATLNPNNTAATDGTAGCIVGVPTLPRMRYRARLGWSNGPWSVTGFMDYIGHYYHSGNAPPNVNGNFCAPDGVSPMPIGVTGGNAGSPCNIKHYSNLLPAWYTFDLSVGYDTGDNPANSYLKNIALQVVVQDLLDKHAGFQYRLQATGGNLCTCEILKPLYGRQISFVISKTW